MNNTDPFDFFAHQQKHQMKMIGQNGIPKALSGASSTQRHPNKIQLTAASFYTASVGVYDQNFGLYIGSHHTEKHGVHST